MCSPFLFYPESAGGLLATFAAINHERQTIQALIADSVAQRFEARFLQDRVFVGVLFDLTERHEVGFLAIDGQLEASKCFVMFPHP